jgi:opacity protein-like surface antigen
MGDRDSPRRRTGKEPMKTSVAAALAGLAMASSPTLGADLFGTAPPPMTFPASQSPVTEVGSNWYLRGDIGLSVDQAPSFSMAAISMPTGAGFLPFSSAIGSSRPHDDFSADIGVGYRYNNWLRFEGTYEYRTAASGKNMNSVLCPTALTPAPIGSPTPTGYVYDQTGADTSVCTGALDLTRRDSTALAAAYLDLGNYWGVTPYVGGGLGLNADMISGNVGYTVNSTGNPYSADLTAPSGPGTVPQVWQSPTGGTITQPNIGFTNQNWNRSISVTHYTMAWALMAGLGFQISPSATLDVGYRYLNAGTSTLLVTPQTGASVKLPNVSQDFRIGIRYMAN